MKEEIVHIHPSELVIGENSRWRADENLSELMESIKQNGMLQPIVARIEDNIVVCGNRRLAAVLKLGLSSVPVRFVTGVSDKQLLILNLTENMQRKDINTIEIGRLCDIMLKNSQFKLSLFELATSIGINQNRIKTCIKVFNSLPAEFRDKLVSLHNAKYRKWGELPEAVAYVILTFGRQYKKLTDEELKMFLQTAVEEKITVAQVNLIGQLVQARMPFKKALQNVNDYTICRVDCPVLKTELASAMKKADTRTKTDFFKQCINKAYPNLIC
jgi:ParB/RepB/Spo0J family partition protein